MRTLFYSALSLLLTSISLHAADAEEIVNSHILPGYEAFADASQALERAAVDDCSSESPRLLSAYHDAFDAWTRVSHLRFGPSEVDDRGFALAFWPDPRGSTPKTLASLLANEDPIIQDASNYGEVSIAGRGFYALEFLLFDAQFTESANPVYVCELVRTVTVDINLNASAILLGWTDGYADLLRSPGNDTYRDKEEALRQLFTSLMTGLEFTSQTRLGRPMGTFDRPRPTRAEARRSGRSLAQVILSLEATQELAQNFVGEGSKIDLAFADAIETASSLDDPVFANVADVSGRIRVESLKLKVDDIRKDLAFEVGETLGIAAGFNALDGD